MKTSKIAFEAFHQFPGDYSKRIELARAELAGTSPPLESSVGSGELLIGLKLGRRTYFENNCSGGNANTSSFSMIPVASAASTTKKIKSSCQSAPPPRCQVEGCNLDLSLAKGYHRRHKVCESHSKCPKVVVGGLECRFCQQCSRFHSLSEFDEKKRSCRKRLCDHNKQRGNPQQAAIQFKSTRLPSPFLVWKPPDPQGEKNASPTCKTLSANRQTALENEGVGQHQVPNEFLLDSIGGPNSLNSENGLLEDVIRTPTLHDSCTDSYPDMIPLHIAPIFKERGEAGGSSEWGLQLRDLTYTNPNTLEFPLPQMTSTQMVSENMEISQDWRNLLASPTEAFQEVNVSGSNNWIVPTSFDPALSQPTRSIPHTMPIIPSMLPISPHIMPTITHMTSHLTVGEDVSYVTLKPKYGRTTMKFHFPTKSGITELKEEVSKRLELELGSFNIEYKDEDGDDVLIGCDEDFRLCLQHFSPLGTQAIRLSVIDKDPIATNICES